MGKTHTYRYIKVPAKPASTATIVTIPDFDTGNGASLTVTVPSGLVLNETLFVIPGTMSGDMNDGTAPRDGTWGIYITLSGTTLTIYPWISSDAGGIYAQSYRNWKYAYLS